MNKGYVFFGVATDILSGINTFPWACKVVDFFIFDNDIFVQYTADGINWIVVFIPADSFYSIDFDCVSVRWVNAVPGAVAIYQIIGYA